MPTEDEIVKTAHFCCTCDYWHYAERKAGEKKETVIYASFQKGICFGTDIYAKKPTTPMTRCKRWRLWKALT